MTAIRTNIIGAVDPLGCSFLDFKIWIKTVDEKTTSVDSCYTALGQEVDIGGTHQTLLLLVVTTRIDSPIPGPWTFNLLGFGECLPNYDNRRLSRL